MDRVEFLEARLAHLQRRLREVDRVARDHDETPIGREGG
jgi:hypothetical protein